MLESLGVVLKSGTGECGVKCSLPLLVSNLFFKTICIPPRCLPLVKNLDCPFSYRACWSCYGIIEHSFFFFGTFSFAKPFRFDAIVRSYMSYSQALKSADRKPHLGPVHTETFSFVFVLFQVMSWLFSIPLRTVNNTRTQETFPSVRGLKLIPYICDNFFIVSIIGIYVQFLGSLCVYCSEARFWSRSINSQRVFYQVKNHSGYVLVVFNLIKQ